MEDPTLVHGFASFILGMGIGGLIVGGVLLRSQDFIWFWMIASIILVIIGLVGKAL